MVLRNAAASPFSVNVQFTGGCLFRYKVDGKSESQHYFQKGQQTQIQAKRQVEIWASNGGALNVTISGNSVDMGSPGEIIARKIGWVSRATGSGYLLEMTHLK